MIQALKKAGVDFHVCGQAIPWRAAALERGKPTFGFFETLQSRYGDGWS
jgi:hypothetical protein